MDKEKIETPKRDWKITMSLKVKASSYEEALEQWNDRIADGSLAPMLYQKVWC